MSREELRLAGSGGQGVILASVIIAESALQSGKYVSQSQSYGPEARGGSCKAEVLVSDNPIGFTKVQSPTFLMALTQKALDDYWSDHAKGCVVLVDSHLKVPEGMKDCKVIDVPILETAQKKIGKVQTANIVAIGCIASILDIGDKKTVEKAVLMHVPKGTEALNMEALEEGFNLVSLGKSCKDSSSKDSSSKKANGDCKK